MMMWLVILAFGVPLCAMLLIQYWSWRAEDTDILDDLAPLTNSRREARR
jgi:hypothetical protein